MRCDRTGLARTQGVGNCYIGQIRSSFHDDFVGIELLFVTGFEEDRMSFVGIRKGLLLSLSLIATIAIAYVIGVFAAGAVASARYEKLERQRRRKRRQIKKHLRK